MTDGYDVEQVAKLRGELPVEQLVSKLAEFVERCRADAPARRDTDDECALCGGKYPRARLLAPTTAEGLQVCPACVFDGDLMGEVTASLVLDLDHMSFPDPAYPARWTAVAALLAYAARAGLAEWLKAQWQEAGLFEMPIPHWSDPGSLWMWLPPRDRRPGRWPRWDLEPGCPTWSR